MTTQALTMRRDLIASAKALRAESEETLAAKFAELHDLYMSAPSGYYSIDADGRKDVSLMMVDNSFTTMPGMQGEALCVVQDIPRLFTPFRQVSEGLARTHQGAGLGLALTRRLVQAQGGTLTVTSTPGVGSVFSFTLPRVQRDAPFRRLEEPT
jgi:light-regulated signal transduction histidine kinase (bacteriophytochrome)